MREAVLLLMWLGRDAARTAESLPSLLTYGKGGVEDSSGPRRLLVAHRAEKGDDLGEAGAMEGSGG